MIFSLAGISFSVWAEWKSVLEYSYIVIFRLAKQDLKCSTHSSVIEDSSKRG
jgi:hypothetical protein